MSSVISLTRQHSYISLVCKLEVFISDPALDSYRVWKSLVFSLDRHDPSINEQYHAKPT
jgi:hypothetical protein